MNNVIPLLNHVIDKFKTYKQKNCSWAITNKERVALRYFGAFQENKDLVLQLNKNLVERQAEILGGSR